MLLVEALRGVYKEAEEALLVRNSRIRVTSELKRFVRGRDRPRPCALGAVESASGPLVRLGASRHVRQMSAEREKREIG